MGHFEWVGPFKRREYLYHYVASMDPVDHATHRVALTVETRAIQNLAAQHNHTRIVPHSKDDTEPARIEFHKGGGKYPASSYNVELVAPDAVALEYGHAPSGHFAGTATKAPAGTYILHRAADLGSGRAEGPGMTKEFREQIGRPTAIYRTKGDK